MKIKTNRAAKKLLMITVAVSAAAGFINGFMGSGAGTLLMFLLSYINKGNDENTNKDNFAMIVMSVLPLSLLSIGVYYSKGAIDTELVSRYALPAAIGGFIGAILCDKLKAKALRIIFSVIVIIAGINMII